MMIDDWLKKRSLKNTCGSYFLHTFSQTTIRWQSPQPLNLHDINMLVNKQLNKWVHIFIFNIQCTCNEINILWYFQFVLTGPWNH